MLEPCEFRIATHVRVDGLPSGAAHKIIGKWGINPDGSLAKMSEGGFGCRISTGEHVDMWNALAYYKET
jgi:hypothetical protein